MFMFNKKNAAQAAATTPAPGANLTPEQIEAAIRKEERSLHRKEVAKKVFKNTFNGIISAVVGIVVYRFVEDRWGGGSSDTNCSGVPADTTTAADLEAVAIEADASYDYTSLD